MQAVERKNAPASRFVTPAPGGLVTGANSPSSYGPGKGTYTPDGRAITLPHGFALSDLARAYKSQVDPRLNYEQALELAMRIATVARSS